MNANVATQKYTDNCHSCCFLSISACTSMRYFVAIGRFMNKITISSIVFLFCCSGLLSFFFLVLLILDIFVVIVLLFMHVVFNNCRSVTIYDANAAAHAACEFWWMNYCDRLTVSTKLALTHDCFDLRAIDVCWTCDCVSVSAQCIEISRSN